MKLHKRIFGVLTAIAVTLLAYIAPVSANILTSQGVTFQTLSSGNTLTLIITNALSGPDTADCGSDPCNWADIAYINAFEIKDIGDVTGASLAGWTTTTDKGLSTNTMGTNGCTTGGTPGACFYRDSALALSDSMTFVINFEGNNLDFSAPKVKVQFFEAAYQVKATGDLLSKTIPAVPEPEIYAMLAVGLGVMGWAARRQRRKHAFVV